MPKKHQQKAFLTKPQSSTPHTLSSSKSATQNESTSRNVNDLIRESRRLQIRNESRNPQPSSAASIPPSLRAVLDLPPPPPPVPRFGARPGGPSRLRRIPGPPPPRSWLTDSIHAPSSARTAAEADVRGLRIQVRSSNLPDGAFPPAKSLQNLVLKKIASTWEWHAQNDYDYLEILPTNLKETLLSYLAVYNEAPINPLRLLFLNNEHEERAEVHRLDLSNALGVWTTFKQLERDLVVKQPPVPKPDVENETWETAEDSDGLSSPAFMLGTVHNFINLKHLSLAIPPVNAKAVSWSSLLSLAAELRTLTSLSLANWPQPTFTPNAASTRAVIKTPRSPPVVYGGSDMYTAHDNDWREAAGILRTLSRSLYCLKWLDLTGCGDWFAALRWRPSSSSSDSSSLDRYGPEWNGGWRGVERLILEVGWKPMSPYIDATAPGQGQPAWNVEDERKMYRYKNERQRYAEIHNTAQSVARYLRALRKEGGGRWIEVDISEELPL